MKNLYSFLFLLTSMIISFAQPVMQFKQKSFNLGKVNDLKTQLKVEYRFKNSGNKPLRIFYVIPENTSDECIFPEIINPSDSGLIIIYPKLNYQIGHFSKIVRVYTNLGFNHSEYLSYYGRSVDSSGPIIQFENLNCVFDTVYEGDYAVAKYKFTNTGNQPLIINNVQSSCGCVTPSWMNEPVMPGKSGVINAMYNSSGRMGTFTKSLTVTSNSIVNNVQVLLINGVVRFKLIPVTFSTVEDDGLHLIQKGISKVIVNDQVDTLWCDFGEITTGEIYESVFEFKKTGSSNFHINFDDNRFRSSCFVNLNFSAGTQFEDNPNVRFHRIDSSGIIKWDFSNYEKNSNVNLNEGYINIRIQNLVGRGGHYKSFTEITSNSNKKIVIAVKAILIDGGKVKSVEILESYNSEIYYYENGKLSSLEKKNKYSNSNEKYYLQNGRIYKWEFLDRYGNRSQYGEVIQGK